MLFTGEHQSLSSSRSFDFKEVKKTKKNIAYIYGITVGKDFIGYVFFLLAFRGSRIVDILLYYRTAFSQITGKYE